MLEGAPQFDKHNTMVFCSSVHAAVYTRRVLSPTVAVFRLKSYVKGGGFRASTSGSGSCAYLKYKKIMRVRV